MSSFAFSLRAYICTFAILLLGVVSNASAQSGRQADSDFDFPYQAIVRNDDTEIFSGPASVHYTTDKVAQGEIVQVYRHDPGGWCAIRPIEGSFSLIPEAAVEIFDDSVGEITQDNTQAWVGTRLGSVDKPLWQIKLKAGERVEILGEASWPNPGGNSTVWYQIAPPAGEFRWVRFADLSTPPTNTRPAPDARTSSLALNKTDSGFKYDELPETESDVEKSTESGFEYVGDQPKEAAPLKNKSRSVSTDRIAKGRSKDGNTESDWEWSSSVGERPGQATLTRLTTRDRDTSQTPAADTPARDSQEGIDFKFRPIGQSASLSGRFQSKPKPKTSKEKVIRDPAVAKAAYQGSIYDSSDRSSFTSELYDTHSQS